MITHAGGEDGEQRTSEEETESHPLRAIRDAATAERDGSAVTNSTNRQRRSSWAGTDAPPLVRTALRAPLTHAPLRTDSRVGPSAHTQPSGKAAAAAAAAAGAAHEGAAAPVELVRRLQDAFEETPVSSAASTSSGGALLTSLPIDITPTTTTLHAPHAPHASRLATAAGRWDAAAAAAETSEGDVQLGAATVEELDRASSPDPRSRSQSPQSHAVSVAEAAHRRRVEQASRGGEEEEEEESYTPSWVPPPASTVRAPLSNPVLKRCPEFTREQCEGLVPKAPLGLTLRCC